MLIICLRQALHATKDVISVFSRMGQNFDRLPGWGAKYEKNKVLCAKTPKSHYFSNSGGTNAPRPAPPPTNDVSASNALQ